MKRNLRMLKVIVNYTLTWPLRMLGLICTVIYITGVCIWYALKDGDSFTGVFKYLFGCLIDGIVVGFKSIEIWVETGFDDPDYEKLLNKWREL